MAHISSKDIVIKLGAASSEVDRSSDILAFNGFPISVMTEEGHGYGAIWTFFETVGMKSLGDITLTVFFNSATSAYTVLHAALGSTLSIIVQFGGTGQPRKQATVIVASENISAERGSLVKADFVLRLASAVVEDTVP